MVHYHRYRPGPRQRLRHIPADLRRRGDPHARRPGRLATVPTALASPAARAIELAHHCRPGGRDELAHRVGRTAIRASALHHAESSWRSSPRVVVQRQIAARRNRRAPTREVDPGAPRQHPGSPLQRGCSGHRPAKPVLPDVADRPGAGPRVGRPEPPGRAIAAPPGGTEAATTVAGTTVAATTVRSTGRRSAAVDHRRRPTPTLLHPRVRHDHIIGTLGSGLERASICCASVVDSDPDDPGDGSPATPAGPDHRQRHRFAGTTPSGGAVLLVHCPPSLGTARARACWGPPPGPERFRVPVGGGGRVCCGGDAAGRRGHGAAGRAGRRAVAPARRRCAALGGRQVAGPGGCSHADRRTGR